jgi:acetyltransferase-like isoleucine patch superfamily enzyme
MRIGSFCSIADEVTFVMGGEHDTERVTTYPLNVLLGDFSLPWVVHEKGPIVIGNDVWIGYGATILSGVTIGDGAVIGARSVVTRDVPPYCIAAGNPARVLRPRFSPEVVQWLQELRWWDWDIDTIRANAKALLNAPNLRGEDLLGGNA